MLTSATAPARTGGTAPSPAACAAAPASPAALGIGELPPSVRDGVRLLCGDPWQATPVGRSGATLLLSGTRGRCILKLLPADLAGVDIAVVLQCVRAAGVAAPALLGLWQESSGAEAAAGTAAPRWAAFEFVAGQVPRPGSAGWSQLWSGAGHTLQQLARVELPALPGVLPRPAETWRHRVATLDASGGVAALRARLDETPPSPLRFAHGDFAPQNMLLAGPRLVLLDWEAFGHAPAGFDAGWVCALNAIGAGPQFAPRQLEAWLAPLELSPAEVWSGTGMGLLRLLWRASGWARRDAALQPVVDRVALAIARHAVVAA
ncbi:MAG: aminoglycoside phosphotransferase family protein [Gemmatimonadaceae bacterium]|nr:aminoglycoside phosphotransferase family protein [Gemmatimonadaceae bacterium]